MKMLYGAVDRLHELTMDNHPAEVLETIILRGENLSIPTGLWNPLKNRKCDDGERRDKGFHDGFEHQVIYEDGERYGELYVSPSNMVVRYYVMSQGDR